MTFVRGGKPIASNFNHCVSVMCPIANTKSCNHKNCTGLKKAIRVFLYVQTGTTSYKTKFEETRFKAQWTTRVS